MHLSAPTDEYKLQNMSAGRGHSCQMQIPSDPVSTFMYILSNMEDHSETNLSATFYPRVLLSKLISPKRRINASVNRVSIGSANGLSPMPHQAIFWTNAGLLSIGPLGTNFGGIFVKIQNFSFTNMHLKISSAKRWPFCPGGDWLNVLVC